jgi:hypothetical protein
VGVCLRVFNLTDLSNGISDLQPAVGGAGEGGKNDLKIDEK